jgi:hypothetical protein
MDIRYVQSNVGIALSAVIYLNSGIITLNSAQHYYYDVL